MKANFKREVKRNKNKHKIRQETRENGPLLSRVVDPPGTKGGPRVGNFPGPPKNTFCPGWSHDPRQKALLFRVVAAPGTKAPPLCPEWSHDPGQKAPILYMCAPCSSSPNTWFLDLRCFSAAASAISAAPPPPHPPSATTQITGTVVARPRAVARPHSRRTVAPPRARAAPSLPSPPPEPSRWVPIAAPLAPRRRSHLTLLLSPQVLSRSPPPQLTGAPSPQDAITTATRAMARTPFPAIPAPTEGTLDPAIAAPPRRSTSAADLARVWLYVPLFPAKGRNAISKLFLGALLQIPRTLTQYLDLFLNFCSELVNSFKNRRKIIKMQIRTFWNPCE